jgi:hypothetical protein
MTPKTSKAVVHLVVKSSTVHLKVIHLQDTLKASLHILVTNNTVSLRKDILKVKAVIPANNNMDKHQDILHVHNREDIHNKVDMVVQTHLTDDGCELSNCLEHLSKDLAHNCDAHGVEQAAFQSS